MNQSTLLNLIQTNQFNLSAKRDDTKLITNDKFFPGLPLYPRVYNGTTTFIAVLGNEIPRLGVNALVNLDDHWYIIPVVADLELLPKMKGTYSACSVLVGFANSTTEVDKLTTILNSISTPFDFKGTIETTLNRPTKRFPQSWTVKMNKNLPYKVNLESSIALLSDIKWD